MGKIRALTRILTLSLTLTLTLTPKMTINQILRSMAMLMDLLLLLFLKKRSRVVKLEECVGNSSLRAVIPHRSKVLGEGAQDRQAAAAERDEVSMIAYCCP